MTLHVKVIVGCVAILVLMVFTRTEDMLSAHSSSSGMSTLSLKADITHSPLFRREISVSDARPYNYNGATKDVPKIVMGIFSTTSSDSFEQRQLIRDTYLTVNRSDSLRDRRVCSLLSYESAGMSDDNCVVLYVFVVAAHHEGNADKPMDHHKTDRDILATRISNDDADKIKSDQEHDVVYLNIRENEHNGKTTTFFKWVSTRNHACSNPELVCPHYIAKVDQYTMLFMPSIFRDIVYQLPPPPYNTRIYGGKKTDWYECGMTEYCASSVPQGYMTTMFFYLSTDLAKAVTADNIKHDFVKQRDDFDMARFVVRNIQATKQSITMVSSGTTVNSWFPQPVLGKEQWLRIWSAYEREGVAYV